MTTRVRHQTPDSRLPTPDSFSLADQAFTRASGARLIPGNRVILLRDARENYPAWLDAIGRAERYIHFESYILRDDNSGRQFAEALIERARAGVSVRVLYDWLGAWSTSRRFWNRMRDAGVDVRGFNPFDPMHPFGWIRRDHRKSLIVDGRVGFVTGLCVGDDWVGDPEKGIAPWRDTGIEVRGPAVAEIGRAFAQVWDIEGEPLPRDELAPPDELETEGSVAMRVVATEPASSGLLRVDGLVAAAARRTLWISDAYFAGIPSYVQALRAAALDGVDVRLLVPGGTDIPILRPISRAGYRPLLEAGVRVFEWNGPMMHSKTAVADGWWARVGSSNLNIASWIGNYELDALIEDADFARIMEEQFLEDMENSTELLLRPRDRRRWSVFPPGGRERRRTSPRRTPGSATRAAAGALRLGNTMTAAVANRRVLAPTEARIVGVTSLILLAIGVVAVLWPKLLAWPLAAILLWIGSLLFVRAVRLYREQNRKT